MFAGPFQVAVQEHGQRGRGVSDRALGVNEDILYALHEISHMLQRLRELVEIKGGTLNVVVTREQANQVGEGQCAGLDHLAEVFEDQPGSLQDRRGVRGQLVAPARDARFEPVEPGLDPIGRVAFGEQLIEQVGHKAYSQELQVHPNLGERVVDAADRLQVRLALAAAEQA